MLQEWHMKYKEIILTLFEKSPKCFVPFRGYNGTLNVYCGNTGLTIVTL